MAESTKQLPGVGVVLSTVWNGYGEHSKELWKIVLPYVALLSLQGILSALLASTGYTWLVGGIGVVSITLFFVSIWVGILLMRAMYQITMTGKLDVKKVHKNLGAVVWPFIAVSIIVGMITVAGFIAFIIPGIILSLMYFGASYATIIDGKGISEALSHSLKITKGHKWNLLGVLLLAGIAIGAIYIAAMLIISGTLMLVGSVVSDAWGAGLATIGQAGLDGVFFPISTGIGAMLYGHLNKLAK